MILETILNTLKSQKSHIIYGIVIVGLAGLAYNLFTRKPAIITETKTVTQIVTKKVYVHDNIVTNRTISTKKPDGTVVTETENIVNKSTSFIDKQSNKTEQDQKVTSFLSKYTLSALYPLKTDSLLTPTYDTKNTTLILGYRLFQSNVLLNAGTNFGVNTIYIGVTLEL